MAKTHGREGGFHIEIDRATCLQCAGCVSICPPRALDMLGLDLGCHDPACIGCDLCVRFCPVAALGLGPSGSDPHAAARGRRSAP